MRRLDIVGHAPPGQLRLGDMTLDAGSLARHAAELGRIGRTLGPDGIIALTVCAVADGESGAAFLRVFSALTGVRVVGTPAIVGGHIADSFELTDGVATVFSAAARAAFAPTLNLGLQITNTDIVLDTDDGNYQLDGLATVTTAVLGGTTYLFASGTNTSDGGFSIFTLDASGQATHVGDSPLLPEGADFRTYFALDMQTVEINGETYLYVKTQDGIAATNLTQAYADSLATGLPLSSTMISRTVVNLIDPDLDGPVYVGEVSSFTASLVQAGDFFVASGRTTDFNDTAPGFEFDPDFTGYNYVQTVFSIGQNGQLVANDFRVHTFNPFWDASVQQVDIAAIEIGGTTFIYSAFADTNQPTNPDNNGISTTFVDPDIGLIGYVGFTSFSDFSPASSRNPSVLETVEIGGTPYLVYASRGELNTENEGTLTVFRIGNDGRLTQTDGLQDNATFQFGDVSALETFEIEGITYLVATGRRDEGFSVFEMSADGALTNVANVSSLTVSTPNGDRNNLSNVLDVHPVVVDGVLQLIFTNTSLADGFSIYTVAPPVDLVEASDTGDPTDNVTEDATPTIAIIADAGATITIDWGDGRGPQAQAEGTGVRQEFTIDQAYQQNGQTTITVSSTSGGVTTTQTLTITLQNIPSEVSGELFGTTGNDSIDALSGNDTVFGGAGDDTLVGGFGQDSLEGGTGDDLVQGGGAFDHVHGGAGNDTLDGGAGADHMMGGSGNDLFLVDATGDIAVEAADGGFDTVQSSANYTLGDHVEVLELTGSTGLSGTGSAQGNQIIGTSGADTLSGLGGDDTLEGGDGADQLSGGDDNDRLEGGADNDTLYGGSGNDFMDGGSGADSMFGGAGSDRFIVDNAGDVVVEASGAIGYDEIRASASYTLAANVERLSLTGSDDIDGTGNADDNLITGNTGDNTFRTGGGGSDTFVGGAGEDLLILDVAFAEAVFDFSNRNHVDVTVGGETHRLDSIEEIQFTDQRITLADITPTPEDPVEVFAGDYFVGRAIDMSDASGGAQFLVAGTANQPSNQSNQFAFSNADGDRGRFEGQGFLQPSTGIVDRVLVDTESSTGSTDRIGIQGLHQTLETMQTATWEYYQTNIFNGDDTMVGSYESDYLTGFAGDDILIGGNGDKEGYDVTGPRPGNSPSRITTAGQTADAQFWLDDGDDTLDGRDRDDTLDGSTRDDMLIGGLDDDVLFGGSGTDTAVIAAASSTMTGTDLGGSLETVTADGTDIIHDDVEMIQFNDRTFTYAELAEELTNPNLAPTAVSLENATTTLTEDADTTGRILIAEIAVAEDGKGTNTLSLSDADASLFEIDGTSLYLRAGTTLDFETQAELVVQVAVDDASVGATPDATTTLTLQIGNQNDPATGTIAINGTVEVGETLTATASITDPDGTGPFSYQWQRDGVDISGATGFSYQLTSDDNESRITVVITYTDGSGATDRFVSLPSDPVGGTPGTTFTGTAGDDSFFGGVGNDTANGPAGNDLLTGGADNDNISGDGGLDTLYGGPGNDTLWGGTGADLVGGGVRDDSINGGDNADALFGADGNHTATGGAGNDTIGGAAGDDSLMGDGGNDEVWGSFGNDTVAGGDGNDTVGGFSGDDSVSGDAGDDELWGGIGNDTMDGGSGVDRLGGFDGNDSLNGGDGNDAVFGGLGNDTLLGGSGNDSIFGAAGDDLIDGGSGDDTMVAGPGADVIIFSDGTDVVNFFLAAEDDIDLSSVGSITDATDLFADHLSDNGNGDAVISDGNGNTLTLDGVSENDLTADNFLF